MVGDGGRLYAPADQPILSQPLMLLREQPPWHIPSPRAFHYDRRVYEAVLYRLQGELLLTRLVELNSAAESCFQQALHVARRQCAKSLGLRVAMRLSRLGLRQGKRVAAWQLLATVYNWFTEGYETVDLQEARTLRAGLA